MIPISHGTGGEHRAIRQLIGEGTDSWLSSFWVSMVFKIWELLGGLQKTAKDSCMDLEPRIPSADLG